MKNKFTIPLIFLMGALTIAISLVILGSSASSVGADSSTSTATTEENIIINPCPPDCPPTSTFTPFPSLPPGEGTPTVTPITPSAIPPSATPYMTWTSPPPTATPIAIYQQQTRIFCSANVGYYYAGVYVYIGSVDYWGHVFYHIDHNNVVVSIDSVNPTNAEGSGPGIIIRSWEIKAFPVNPPWWGHNIALSGSGEVLVEAPVVSRGIYKAASTCYAKVTYPI